MKFLPYGQHTIDDSDIEAVVDVLKSGPLTSGPKAAAFEAALAQKIGVKEAVVCSNGTTALHLACMAADLKPGDVAIVPSITFLSTANAVRMCGADVVFADVCANTGLMTPDTLQEAIEKAGSKLKAVLPVHLNGQCHDMDALQSLAKKHAAVVITDCCHALGADYHAGGKPGNGQLEDFACFSFHPVKSIAMGEGGAVTTNNSKAADRMRLLRGHDMQRDAEKWQLSESAFDSSGQANPWYYEMSELAYNYRANDLQCALGISQLEKLDGFVERRRQLADLYDKAFEGLSNLVRPVERAGYSLSAWHLYPVLVDFEALGKERGTVQRALMERGVGTQVHYIPVSNQPYYRKLYGEQNLPGATGYYERALSLPIFPSMSDEDVFRVVEAIKEVCA